MRQIKFRGKRIDNGEWVYGYYLVDDSSTHPTPLHLIIVDEVHDFKSILVEIGGTNFACYKVIPETVGQSVGLKDKKGVEIYEGDVIQHQNFEADKTPYEVPEMTIKGMGEIIGMGDDEWDMGNGQYSNIEIMSNVTDNPELLK